MSFPCATSLSILNCVLEVCLVLYKCVLLWLIRQKLLSFSGEYEKNYYNIFKNSLSGRIPEEMPASMKELITEKWVVNW